MKSVIYVKFSYAAVLAACLSLPLIGAPQQVPVGPPALSSPVQAPAASQDQAPSAGNPAAVRPTDERRSSNALTGPGAPVNSGSYKIGPADVLSIRVWNEPEFSGPVAVHEDGMITLPLVGDLKAGGSTPADVEQEITKSLTKFLVKPLVTVTVQEVGSKRYYLDGGFGRPGEYPLIVPTTILEAVSKAGGITEFANAKKVYILRGDKRIPFNYKDVIRGKHMEQNVLLKPGDHVVAH